MIRKIADEITKLNNLGMLDTLLQDMTTKSNILWGTSAYSKEKGDMYNKDREIKSNLISGPNSNIISTRAEKDIELQTERTKQHAEVFTPFWVCKLMLDYMDWQWLVERGYYSAEDEADLMTGRIYEMLKQSDWQDYVLSRRMELTCGEAPYLCTRYDVSSGELIPMTERTGILDRKLAVVSRYVDDKSEWTKWAFCALRSTYGYEFQGDNLLIARLNLLMTLEDFYEDKFKEEIDCHDLKKAAGIIVWNIWQMDGLTYKIPYNRGKESVQVSWFSEIDKTAKEEEKQPLNNRDFKCVVRKWESKSDRNSNEIIFSDLMLGGEKMFDFIIGNPPYQEDTENTSDKPIYNVFMDAAYNLSPRVELITPARFLFGAGKNLEDFSNQRLSDKDFKVLRHWIDAGEVFPLNSIMGGVAVSYKADGAAYGAIGTFYAHPELKSINEKVSKYEIEKWQGETCDNIANICNDFANGRYKSLSDIIFSPESYKFTDKFHEDHPDAEGKLSKGHKYDLTTNIFTKLKDYFINASSSNSDEYVRIYGAMSKKNRESEDDCEQAGDRTTKYIRREYVRGPSNFDAFKVLLPKSHGAPAIGEKPTTCLIGEPVIAGKMAGHTQTFLSIGNFKNEVDAQACMKYIKTKFARTLLGIFKVTQHNPSRTWRYVPLQDFSSSSDIDWSKSVAEIDEQLYAKYGLSDKEKSFIEEKISEME